MDAQTVPVPPDGMVAISEGYVPLLERTATALVGARGQEVRDGVDDGRAPRHVAELLIERLMQAIAARKEVIAAAEADEGYLSVPTLRLLGPHAVRSEHQRLTDEWECGGEDTRALANHTELLADLSDFLITTPGAWPTDATWPPGGSIEGGRA